MTQGKKAIQRLSRQPLNQLSGDSWASIEPRLNEIYQESFIQGSSNRSIKTVLNRGPDTQLMLVYGPQGEIAGFGSYCMSRYQVRGKTHLVYDAGSYVSNAYAGSQAYFMKELFQQAFRVRITYPRAQIHVVMSCATPAAYRFFTQGVQKLYPHRSFEQPQWSKDMMIEVLAGRDKTIVCQDPVIVKSNFNPQLKDPDRIVGSKALAQDPDASFFLELNPKFTSGHMLGVHIPLTLANILGTGSKILKKTLKPRRNLTKAG
ncbi:hypothetical protein [Pseudobacteriovorax antillogorgiicola]|uniref:Uncharacterized protein n=1 Tax=Pseudobacteriovorax antillogorgiicola TaxID=1513793 RepID=A0A1Y6BJT7_9BACT|nr:hypothetical protein [Pseudobacteriovorax antillogorgiicola]TCS55505.1 hypothetical protein EDD56_105228 [Pseudobacteriovorax antillogorgiicola]SMF11549.1 hypothetical protein SAMN06296036_10596 [Pseudobacteriovorax antillogorgiicola]